MKSILLTLLCTTCFSFVHVEAQTRTSKKVVQSQISSDVVTNASVVQLQQAGLGNDLIISKIESSQTSFDLSASALVALKNQKVDNDIIKAMMIKGSGGKATVAVSQPEKTKSSKVPEVELVNYVYQYDKATNTAIKLEKAIANMHTKAKMMGYGGGSSVYTVEGDKSAVQLSQKDSISFIINTGGAAPDLTLYKLEKNRKSRDATTFQMGGLLKLGKTSSGKNTVSFNVTMLKPGLYQLKPQEKLEQGEYFFAPKANVSATTIDVYAFGIN